jgi:CheY-like chemotaxis protein
MGTLVIVVVDDDVDTLEMMDVLLTEHAYRMILWQDSDSAPALIRREQPQLVILDLQMEHPEAGWLILEQLRQDPLTMQIPAILYSGAVEVWRARRDALRARRSETLAKPFSPADLLSKIQVALGTNART